MREILFVAHEPRNTILIGYVLNCYRVKQRFRSVLHRVYQSSHSGIIMNETARSRKLFVELEKHFSETMTTTFQIAAGKINTRYFTITCIFTNALNV